MAVSQKLIPDFYPGSDVMNIDLRLPDGRGLQTNTGLEGNLRPCFCLKGHICDSESSGGDDASLDVHSPSTRRLIMSGDPNCASVANDYPQNFLMMHFIDWIYNFILTPLTRWDAARFDTCRESKL